MRRVECRGNKRLQCGGIGFSAETVMLLAIITTSCTTYWTHFPSRSHLTLNVLI